MQRLPGATQEVHGDRQRNSKHAPALSSVDTELLGQVKGAPGVQRPAAAGQHHAVVISESIQQAPSCRRSVGVGGVGDRRADVCDPFPRGDHDGTDRANASLRSVDQGVDGLAREVRPSIASLNCCRLAEARLQRSSSMRLPSTLARATP